MSIIEEFSNDAALRMEGPTIDSLVYYSHGCAKEKGWHDPGKERTVGDYLMLMVSELAEALEEFRNGHPLNEVYYHVKVEDGKVVNESKPEGVPIELADVLIRIFDFCGKHDIDIESALLTKMEYNFTRSHRHGGKAI